MLGIPQAFGKEVIIGVDIGSRLLKICLIESIGASRWKVTRTSFAETPPNSVRDGVIIDRAVTASALKELIRTANLGHITGASAAIAGGSVIVRHVKMPNLSSQNLRRSIRYEAGKHISTSIDDSMVEFEIIGPVPGEPDKMNVMLVAAPNDMINSRLETIQLAGLEPVSIDIEAFAVQRALLEIGGQSKAASTTVALLDIGANSTDVTIVTHGHFALTRNISIAGDHFTNAIKNTKRISFEEAEQLKKGVDMSILLDAEAEPESQTLAKLVQPTLDELLREVRRSINYYQGQVSEGSLALPIDPRIEEELSANESEGADKRGTPGQVKKLLITGGSSLLKGIGSYMEVRLGTTVEHWNIFDHPSFDTTQIAPSFIEQNHSIFALCVGLALNESWKSNGNESKISVRQAA